LQPGADSNVSAQTGFGHGGIDGCCDRVHASLGITMPNTTIKAEAGKSHGNGASLVNQRGNQGLR
jgi:hypothetical protein